MKEGKEHAHLEYIKNLKTREKQNKVKAREYLKEYEEQRKLKFLRKAIKINPELLSDKKVKSLLHHIRYRASIPYRDSKTLEARDFLERFGLSKVDKHGEMWIFFGSGYRLESCLGMEFRGGSVGKLITYNDAVFVYFAENLEQEWNKFCEQINRKKFSDDEEKKEKILEMCMNLNIQVSKKDFLRRNLSYANKIALSIIRAANLKRWEMVLKESPNHDLNKILKKYPYFSFKAIFNYYDEIKTKFSPNELFEARKKIESAKKSKNPFKISFMGMLMEMFLAQPKTIS